MKVWTIVGVSVVSLMGAASFAQQGVPVPRDLAWTQTDAVADLVTNYSITIDAAPPIIVQASAACTPDPTLCTTTIQLVPGTHTIAVVARNAKGAGPVATIVYTETNLPIAPTNLRVIVPADGVVGRGRGGRE